MFEVQSSNTVGKQFGLNQRNSFGTSKLNRTESLWKQIDEISAAIASLSSLMNFLG
jgi:hypothetical protein